MPGVPIAHNLGKGQVAASLFPQVFQERQKPEPIHLAQPSPKAPFPSPDIFSFSCLTSGEAKRKLSS